MTRLFPDGFRWGTATSAYQIEGAVAADGRGTSIWDTFCRVPGAISDCTSGDVACDHYRRYAEDVALMAQLGLHAYRFSVAWPRVQPAGSGAVNQAGLDFYSRLTDTLLEHGIEPMVTLYHWDLPQPLEDAGGWPQRDTAARFAEYAAIVAGALGDRVGAFGTLNEPWCSAFLGYAGGQHAPGRTEPAAAYRAVHHLLLGHGLALAALRAELPADRQVSITLNPANVRADSDRADDQRAARHAELATNQVFLDPLLRGALAAELVSATAGITDWEFVRDGDLATISAPIDVLGVNYYFPHRVGATPRPDGTSQPYPGVPSAWAHGPDGPHTAMNWPVEPGSFTELLVRLDKDYPGTTFVITENGSAYADTVAADGAVHDPDRVAYLIDHLGAVRDAIDAGVDIRGYFAWSLLDNFEWSWGLSRRFGLVHVDYGTQERTPKTSASVYRRIIAAHGVPDDE